MADSNQPKIEPPEKRDQSEGKASKKVIGEYRIQENPLRRGFIYLCSADSKRLAAYAFRHKLSAFLCRLCCSAMAPCAPGKQGGPPLSCRLLITYQTLVSKSCPMNPPARFLWILPTQKNPMTIRPKDDFLIDRCIFVSVPWKEKILYFYIPAFIVRSKTQFVH